MRERLLRLLGPIFGVMLAVTPLAPAGATNLNMGAVECQVAFGPADQIFRQPYGINTRPDTETPQSVVCSVPRSPLPAGSNGAFYVDGENYEGAFTTSCAISSFDSDGHLAAIATFTSSAPYYDAFLTLPADAMPVLGHTTLSCVLPAHGKGYLRGVASIQ